MNPVSAPTFATSGRRLVRRAPLSLLRTVLLGCGILSSLWYVAMNVIVPPRFAGYDWVSQAVSELSAVDAPTRPLWMTLGILYTLLVVAFGLGVLGSAGRNRPLRLAGWLLTIYGSLGVLWTFAPMHLRPALAAGQGTASDTAHIALGIITVTLMLLAMGYAASAFGRRFRIYSLVSLFSTFVFGFLTALDAPNLSKNLPTPLLGLYERINIGLFLLWVIVLAIALLRTPEPDAGVS